MIFLGDCSHPFSQPPGWSEDRFPWKEQAVVLNLEGALLDSTKDKLPASGVLNHPSVLVALHNNSAICFLANNHFLDFPALARSSFNQFKQSGIRYFGAGLSAEEATAPLLVDDVDGCILLLGFGWPVVGARSRPRHELWLNELTWSVIQRAVVDAQRCWPDAKVVVNLHWNYELELYPQPAHRSLAHRLIHMGVEAVIGHHPHCVGGVEIIAGKPIVYSLGNWWFPQGVFDSGKVRFPELSKLQLAFEYSPIGDHVAHWYEYLENPHRLEFCGSENLADSAILAQRTPFEGLTEKEYLNWFRQHRIKRRLLPIFKKYDSPIINFGLDRLVLARHKGLMLLEQLGLRKSRGNVQKT